jgi:hypothetical protein
VGHEPLRIRLVHGEQRDDVGAVRARDHKFIGADDAERGLSRRDHLNGRRPDAAGDDLDVEVPRLVGVVDEHRVEPAELRLGLPVQLDRQRRPRADGRRRAAFVRAAGE